MFDYRETWYLACDPPEPPEWALFRADAKAVMIRIGEHAIEHVELDEMTRAVVEARLEALGGRPAQGDSAGERE